jgi:hypothetical protein
MIWQVAPSGNWFLGFVVTPQPTAPVSAGWFRQAIPAPDRVSIIALVPLRPLAVSVLAVGCGLIR